ncbi:TetR/AcrR family transcriptional regulator [Ruegeria sp. 2012CJ41-6]|uniref:TetR/AcrR family transcriptional regulator n=1 Tax=Ruegeria spongiae TaxID=2942209 RepID=A0ABT0PWL3_9RHOB|nr:TetR/AcrR family transcriptional regulator [Ruegeria spongiae]MCL6281995.1 TetR/AcrR family transcriptional regulator [Ruegeria spongiae]
MRSGSVTDTVQQITRRPQQKRGKAKFEAILDATKSMMVESGSVGLRIQDISARSGVSVGGIYQYFPSKEAIVQEIADRYNDWVGALIFADLTEVPEDAAGFEALFREIFEGYAKAHLSDEHSLGIFLCISSEQTLMQRSMEASMDHAQKITEITGHLFPQWSEAQFTQRIYLAMVMSRTLVEAALAAPEADRAALLDTGFDILITSFRRAE